MSGSGPHDAALTRGYAPAARLGDLLARATHRVPPWIAPRNPYLAAQRPHRGAVDDPFDDAWSRGHELAIVALHSLEHDVGHALVVAVKGGIGPCR